MANARSGYKRIMGEIPEEMHEKIVWYNKISAFPLNVSKAIEICLTNKMEEIEQEAIDYIKNNGGISRRCNQNYNNTVDAIKAGLPVYDVYKIALEKDHITHKERDLRSLVYLPLLPINRMELNEEKQTVLFGVDNIVCLALSPFTDDWENLETLSEIGVNDENITD